MIINFLIMVIVGISIGWVTNFLAVKLLFRPYKKINILGFSIQGVIPKRKEELAINIAEIIEKELLSIEDITDTINSSELEEEIEIISDAIVNKKLKEEIISNFPMAKMFLNDKLLNKIKGYIKSVIEDNKDELVKIIIEKFERDADLKGIITKKINEFSVVKLENIVLEVASKEFKHIEFIGGVLGGLIGTVQFIIMKVML
ncbi:MAG: DUF445 domain-containing protein [Fusobacteriota bacterium]